MILDVVNDRNEPVGSVALDDDVVGGRVNTALVWESVVHANAAARRGTHATKTRARVSGSGRKPWKQKGTGRAQVGEIRSPLWRKGGTVFGPQPRSYDYRLPRRVERGALGAALAQRIQDGAVVVINRLAISEPKTKAAADVLRRFAPAGTTILLVDVKPDVVLSRAVRNLAGARVLASGRLTARDLMVPGRVIITQAAVERLGAVLRGQERGA